MTRSHTDQNCLRPNLRATSLVLVLSVIRGAYARYGRANAIGLANAHHKAVVLATLLGDLGCADVRVESNSGFVPQTNVVHFSPTAEVRRMLRH